MKLYTDEQVRLAMYMKADIKYVTYTDDNIIDSLTPIELPSDEEVLGKSIEIMEEWYGSGCIVQIDSHFKGAKWVIEQIKKQHEKDITKD